MAATKLVMGASGFLGSHVTRQLVGRGDEVRVWIRESSSTVGFDDLAVERCYGDLGDRGGLRKAMEGVEAVFYCIVDARAWLRDPTPRATTGRRGGGGAGGGRARASWGGRRGGAGCARAGAAPRWGAGGGGTGRAPSRWPRRRAASGSATPSPRPTCRSKTFSPSP